MNNRFFQLSKNGQRRFQFKIILVTVLGLLTFGIFLFLISPKLIYLCIFLVPIIMTIIAPFFDVPAQVEKGDLKYYSMFFFAEKLKKGVIKIHGGTLFDYYFAFSSEMTQREKTKLVLLEYLKGLNELIQTTEENIRIQGTTYFINEKTANRLGLKKVATNEGQKLILWFNFINITLSMSIVNQKLVFPNLSNIMTFEGKVKDLKKKEEFIQNLIKNLSNHS